MRRGARGYRPFSAIFASTSGRGRRHGGQRKPRHAPFGKFRSELAADSIGRHRIAEAGRPDRHGRSPPAPKRRARRRHFRSRPCRSPESRPRRKPGAPDRAQAPGRPGPRARRCRRPATDAALPGSRPPARSVLINETASAPPASAAAAIAAGSATLGVSFTISGFSLRGRICSSRATISAGCSPTMRPDLTLGQETLSSIAATSLREPTRSTSVAKPSLLGAMTETHRGTEQARQLRQVVDEKALEALVRQADRVDHSRRRLVQTRRRVAGPRLWGDRLRDEHAERKALVEGVAECPPGGDRVEGAGAVDDRVGEADAAELEAEVGLRAQCPLPATSAVSMSAALTTGPSTQSRI